MKIKMFKKMLAVLLMLFVFSNTANATHLMGGEITWECIKTGPDAGKYIFTVKGIKRHFTWLISIKIRCININFMYLTWFAQF